MNVVVDIINGVRYHQERKVRQQSDNRQALIQELECGRYWQHRGDWHDDSGQRFCVLGVAYETARRQVVGNGTALPTLTKALAQTRMDREEGLLRSTDSPLRVIGRTYGFDDMTRSRLAKANDEGANFIALAGMIRELPPPEQNRLLRTIVRLFGPSNGVASSVAVPAGG